MRKAEKACAKYREAIKAPEMSDEDKEKFRKAALEHSRCMREHGIDMPDPKFDEDGGAQIRIGRGSGIDLDDPKFQKAQEACRDKMPMLGSTDAEERAMKRLAGGAAVAAGRSWPRACSSWAATRRRARRSRHPVARDRLGRAARPGRPREPRRHARVRRRRHADRRRRRDADRAARAGHRHHPRPLAVRGRRQAGRVPALRRAAGLARLRALA